MNHACYPQKLFRTVFTKLSATTILWRKVFYPKVEDMWNVSRNSCDFKRFVIWKDCKVIWNANLIFIENCGIKNSHRLSGPDSTRAEVPNLGYMYPWGYICLSAGVHLRLAIEVKYIFTYFLLANIYTYISEYYSQKPLSVIYLWLIMIKYFVIGNLRGARSSVEMLKG